MPVLPAKFRTDAPCERVGIRLNGLPVYEAMRRLHLRLSVYPENAFGYDSMCDEWYLDAGHWRAKYDKVKNRIFLVRMGSTAKVSLSLLVEYEAALELLMSLGTSVKL